MRAYHIYLLMFLMRTFGKPVNSGDGIVKSFVRMNVNMASAGGSSSIARRTVRNAVIGVAPPPGHRRIDAHNTLPYGHPR